MAAMWIVVVVVDTQQRRGWWLGGIAGLRVCVRRKFIYNKTVLKRIATQRWCAMLCSIIDRYLMLYLLQSNRFCNWKDRGGGG